MKEPSARDSYEVRRSAGPGRRTFPPGVHFHAWREGRFGGRCATRRAFARDRDLSLKSRDTPPPSPVGDVPPSLPTRFSTPGLAPARRIPRPEQRGWELQLATGADPHRERGAARPRAVDRHCAIEIPRSGPQSPVPDPTHGAHLHGYVRPATGAASLDSQRDAVAHPECQRDRAPADVPSAQLRPLGVETQALRGSASAASPRGSRRSSPSGCRSAVRRRCRAALNARLSWTKTAWNVAREPADLARRGSARSSCAAGRSC